MELLEDVLPHFLYCSRNSIVKGGSTPNFTYTTTPTHWGSTASLPTGKKGLSITVVKNGEVFGFSGCVVTQQEYTVDNAIAGMKFGIIGRVEAEQSLPTYTAVATDTPFSAAHWTIEVPTASQIFDVTNFTLTINDNGEAQNRLTGSRYAQWVKFGEREVMLELERDFDTRDEWDVFKALTSRSITVTLEKNAGEAVTFLLPAAVIDSHDVDGLSDQGSATMQSVSYQGNYDPTTSKSYEIVVACQSDIT